jgi:hypothetical protein
LQLPVIATTTLLEQLISSPFLFLRILGNCSFSIGVLKRASRPSIEAPEMPLDELG